MLKEQYLQQLLTAVYNEDTLNIYDYAAGVFTTQSEEFTHTKSWSDQLVKDKLATYGNAEHTTLQITNYGKYWIMKGGYEIFLKEGYNTKEKQKDKDVIKEKEALLEARLRLTHYRLVGFWLTIILSSMGFILSLYNLFLIMNGRK
jgi:hypothetical protein